MLVYNWELFFFIYNWELLQQRLSNARREEEEEEEVSFIKSITLCSSWTELRVLSQFIKIFKLYITRLKNIKSY